MTPCNEYKMVAHKYDSLLPRVLYIPLRYEHLQPASHGEWDSSSCLIVTFSKTYFPIGKLH